MTDPIKRERRRWGIVQLGEIASWIEFVVYVAVFVLFIISVVFWR